MCEICNIVNNPDNYATLESDSEWPTLTIEAYDEIMAFATLFGIKDELEDGSGGYVFDYEHMHVKGSVTFKNSHLATVIDHYETPKRGGPLWPHTMRSKPKGQAGEP